MTRLKSTIIALIVVTSVVAAPAAAQSSDPSDVFTGPADDVGGVIGATVPDHAVTYGASGTPGWYVWVDEGKTESVESWANQSDERTIRSIDNGSSRVLVSAPTSHIGVSTIDQLLNNGLASKSYVVQIGLHQRMENVEPVDPIGEDAYTVPLRDRVFGAYLSSGDFNTEGVAFSGDVNATDMTDVKDSIGATSVHTSGVNGTNVSIAVIDTGANVKDGVVFGNGTSGSNIRIEYAYNTIEDTEANVSGDDYSAVEDGNLHGTWVAAAAAGSDGVAPNASLQVYKALSDDGQGSTEDIIQAVELADEQGADVVAMSLGSPIHNKALAEELKEALEGNVTAFSIAVGNSRQTTRYVSSPGDVDDVIGVAAATTANASDAESAYFSNVGPDRGTDGSRLDTRGVHPDISAPGFKVTVEVIDSGGFTRNETLSGTSMAQPMVAGSIALLLDSDESLKNDTETVNEITVNASAPAPNMGVTETGYGYLNASNMVNKEYPGTTQLDSRTDEAESRDIANIALAGRPSAEGPRAEG